MTKPKPIPMDRLRGDKRAALARLELPFDYDLADLEADAKQAVRDAEDALDRATNNARPGQGDTPGMVEARAKLREAREAHEAALEALRPTVRRFIFRAIPTADYDQLLIDWPPTKEQRERHGAEAPYNPKEFCPRLVARTLVWTGTGNDEWPTGKDVPRRPAYTEDEVKALYDATEDLEAGDDELEDDGDDGAPFAPAELEALFGHAFGVCRTRRTVDLGKEGSPSA